MEFNPKDLTSRLPSADDVIRALGLQTRSKTEVVPGVALFGAGLLVGAGLALLLAPTSGRELREEIGERATDLRERATSALESAVGSEPNDRPE